MAEMVQPSGLVAATAERPRWRWSPADTVIAISAGLIFIVFAIFALLCVQGYSATLQGANAKAQAAADLVAEEASWMLGSARATLKQIAGTVSVPADIADIQKSALDGALAGLPVPASLGFYDASGSAWGDAGSPSLPPSIADTDVFKALEAGGDWTISPQLADQKSGGSLFVVAQRLGTDAFGGVVLLAIDGKAIERFWEPAKLGTDSSASLVRQDGWLIGRHPALPQTVNLNTSPPFTSLADAPSGSYTSPRSPVDGIARIVAFHRLPQLGVIAIVGISQDAAIAPLWTAIITVLWLMVPIALALLAGSLLTSRILRQSQRTQASLAAAVAHNEVLFREIHHRVKNNLQSVGALLQMQPIPRDIKTDMSQRIAAMSAVHEHIYRSNNFATVRVKDYLQTLIENLRGVYDPRIMVIEEFEDLSVDKDAATPLGLIVNEVVSNAFKHAFPDGREGTISVQLKRLAGDRGELVVEDNGTGFDPSVPAKGIGRRLIAALTQQLDGEAEASAPSGGGSRFTLRFPLAKDAPR